jgi:membrane fusion protein (multidrug efflux system)
LLVAACGSQEQAAAPPNAPPPEVVVTTVTPQTVPMYGEYVARTEALQTVDIMSRVDGFLDKILFEEGTKVKTGQLLFVIDQRPFRAALQEARGNLAHARASLARARKDVKRLQPLVADQAAPEMDLDHAQAEVELGKATIDRATAAITMAELNLKFTEIRAPITGIIGKQEVAVGNVVRRDQSRLATISSWDPMRVVFSMSEADFLQRIQQTHAGNPFVPETDADPFELILTDGSVYPHRGRLSFLDRTLNPTTGTLSVYVSFPNPDRLLRPGLFGRVRVMLEEKSDVLLVPQRSVQVFQGVDSVLVVGKDDSVTLRTVTLGSRYQDFFIVTDGLNAGDVVIVEGLQNAMPGRKVAPRPQPAVQPAAGG